MSDKILDDNNYGTRDKKGNWKPYGTIPINPPHIVPFEPLKLLKYILGYPGLLVPWQGTFALITIFCWFILTPSLEQMKTFEIGWIAFIFLRNAILILLWTGFFHLRFYILKSQRNS